MPSEKGRTVAVTGTSGYLGGRLVEMLCADPRVSRVLGFDVAPPATQDAKFVADTMDVRDPALQARLESVDCLIHLAFIMDPILDETEMRDVNVNGSQNVFRCAGAAGVPKIVYTSSGVAYGAHPDNPVPLTETSPLRANLDFNYAAHKLEVEYVVKEFRADHKDVPFVVFRPSIVLGPRVDNAWTHMLFEMPAGSTIAGHNPQLQFVHEDDVARALTFAVFEDLDGPYNLTPAGSISLRDAMAASDRRIVDVPEPLAFSLVDRMWRLGLAEAPAGMLHYAMHPWVMSNDRLVEAGFRFGRSALETLVETARDRRDYVRLGPRKVRRQDLRRGALTGLGAAGAVVAARSLRRLMGRSAG